MFFLKRNAQDGSRWRGARSKHRAALLALIGIVAASSAEAQEYCLYDYQISKLWNFSEYGATRDIFYDTRSTNIGAGNRGCTGDVALLAPGEDPANLVIGPPVYRHGRDSYGLILTASLYLENAPHPSGRGCANFLGSNELFGEIQNFSWSRWNTVIQRLDGISARPTNSPSCPVAPVIKNPQPAKPNQSDCTKGNPIQLNNVSKVESIACMVHQAPGMDINFGMNFARPRVSRLADGQTGAYAWTHSYNRRMFTHFNPAPSGTDPGLRFRRIQLENGEVYDFVEDGGNAGSYVSIHGYGYGSLREEVIGANQVFVYTYPDGNQDTYDSTGRLIRVQDRTGSYLTLTRSGNTQLDITSWPSNRTVRVTYVDQGGGNFQPTAVVDLNPPSGTPARSASMQYTNGMLTRFTDAAGRVFQYRYDSQKRMIQRFDALNNPDVLGSAAKSTQIFYRCATCPEVSYEILGNGSRLDFTPITGQAWNLEVKETGADNSQRIFRYTFDNRDLMVRSYVPNSTTKYTETTFDFSGNAVDRYDPERRRVNFGYDYKRFVNRIRVYKDETSFDETLLINDEYGQVLEVTDPTGMKSFMIYDSRGLLTRTTVEGASLTQTTTINYAPVSINGQLVEIGLPTSVTLPDGTVNTQTYDSRGYPMLLTYDSGGLNITEATTFDGRGFLVASVDKRGVRTAYEYNNNPANGQFGQVRTTPRNKSPSSGVMTALVAC